MTAGSDSETRDVLAGWTGSELFADARVLVVDDLAANVVLMKRILAEAGVGQIHGLTDPRQVAEWCRVWQPDLVLLDLHMPHMDGVAVLQMMQAVLPDDAFVPALILTADATPVARERALTAGAKDFVTKPFDRMEVLLRVRNLLETRALYSRVQGHKAVLQAQLDRRLAEDRRTARDRRVRANRIRSVLDREALHMVFQPICDIREDAVVGFEALARIDAAPRRTPNVWFDEAETVGLGLQLELLATDRALGQLDSVDSGCFLSINVSAATASTAALASQLAAVAADRVLLELTEHIHVDDYAALSAALDGLRLMGVRIAVDDAGSGYAGLQHILKLRPDVIKLDLDLTRGITADPARRALASAMVDLSRDLEATLVAEGVETRDDLETLRELGVAWAQGYHLGRPGPLPDRAAINRRCTSQGLGVRRRSTN